MNTSTARQECATPIIFVHYVQNHRQTSHRCCGLLTPKLHDFLTRSAGEERFTWTRMVRRPFISNIWYAFSTTLLEALILTGGSASCYFGEQLAPTLGGTRMLEPGHMEFSPVSASKTRQHKQTFRTNTKNPSWPENFLCCGEDHGITIHHNPPHDFRQQDNQQRFCPNIVESKITIAETLKTQRMKILTPGETFIISTTRASINIKTTKNLLRATLP